MANADKMPPHFLKEWRVFRNMTQDDLAAKASIGRTAISKIEAGAKPLMQNRLAAFANALDIAIPQLYERPAGKNDAAVDIHTPNRAKQSLAETSLGRVRSATGEPAAFGPKDVKVLGFVKAGKIGWYPDNGSTLEMTDRPPMLVGVPDAYAVYIDDRSMFPALKPGHMVWVHPFRPPRPEDFVVVQVSEEEAYIKEYVRKTDKHVICRQYNPAEELKYPISAKIHVVVGVRLVG